MPSPTLPPDGTAPSGRSPHGETVLALDNVPITLPVAGFGNRVLAAALDLLLVGVLTATASLAVLVAVTVLGLGLAWGAALWLLTVFAITTGYFAVLEILMSGQTPGKRALGLRVLTRAGGTPPPSALLIRNLLRVVDHFVAVPLMAADPLARRLGDHLAGTLVVRLEAPRAEVVLQRVPRGWGPHHIAVAESFLARFGELEPDRARALARRFLALVARDDPELLASALPSPDPVATLLHLLRPEAP